MWGPLVLSFLGFSGNIIGLPYLVYLNISTLHGEKSGTMACAHNLTAKKPVQTMRELVPKNKVAGT